jgi:hypothetical protein
MVDTVNNEKFLVVNTGPIGPAVNLAPKEEFVVFVQPLEVDLSQLEPLKLDLNLASS